jgi:hypothetical protein
LDVKREAWAGGVKLDVLKAWVKSTHCRAKLSIFGLVGRP